MSNVYPSPGDGAGGLGAFPEPCTGLSRSTREGPLSEAEGLGLRIGYISAETGNAVLDAGRLTCRWGKNSMFSVS